MEQPTKQVKEFVQNNYYVRQGRKWHKQNDCCCWFFTTKTGVQIVTVGVILGLLEEYAAFNLFRFICKVAVVVPFAMMLFQDTAFNRLLALLMFCICIPLIFVINFLAYQNVLVDNVMFAEEICGFSKFWIKTFGGSKEENEAQQECNEADEEDQAACEADLDQCPILPGGVLKVLFVITPIVVIMNIHIAFVLYTHWKNSCLPEDQGGCADNEGPPEDEDFEQD